MDDPAPLMHVDWQRWFQKIADLVAQPLTSGMIPDIPFTKIAMTASPRLLGRTTAGAGPAEQIAVSAPLTLAAGALGLSTPLLAVFGGTGFASYAVGDVLYADTTTTLAKLADVSAGSYLRSGGVTTAPLWSTVKIPNTATTGDLWYASAANTIIARTIGSAADVLTVAGGIPTWAPPAAASTVTITDDTTTNATMFPTWVTANSGALPLKVTSTKFSFNPSTGTLTVPLAVHATSVSTPSLISTTALTITPVAGSNLNVSLSTTGDFAVNTNQLYVDTSAGRVGIKTSAPVAALDINDATGFTVRNGATDGFGLTQSGANQWDWAAISGGSTFRIVNANVLATVKMFVGAATTPTAKLHLGAGTTAATTAPLKFTSGPLMTAAEAGAVEFLTDDYYATITTGAARKGIVLNNGANLTSGNIPIATTNGRLIDGPTLPLSAANGGTGTGTYAVGDVLYADTTTTLARLADVAVGSYLRSGGVNTAPLWSTLKLPNAATANRVVYATSTDTYGESANLTFTGSVLTVTGTETVSGLITASSGVQIDGGSFASGRIYKNATNGLSFGGITGATYDFVIITPSGSATLLAVPTGTTNVEFGSNITLAGKITKYNNVNTAGWGVPAIYGSGRSVAQAAAVASVTAYTVPAADGSFLVDANVLVTTATTHNFTVAVDYTDEGNTARTLTLTFSSVAGVLLTAITNVTGAGPYEGLTVHIRCKASTAITVKTVGTFTTVTYNVEGSIRQIA